LHQLLNQAQAPVAPPPEADTTDFSKHPSMLRNASETMLARADISQKKAQIWPSVYVRLHRQFLDAQTARQIGSPTADTQLRIGVDYTPGAGLAQAALIQSSIDQLQVLQQERDQIGRELADQRQTQWQNHANNALRLSQAQQSVQNAQEVQAAYVRLFTVGRRNWLDVLNAVRDLNQAEQLLAQLQAQQAISRYRLMLLLSNWFDELITP
jgi:adhesin transport system outer membrane protein